MVTSELRSIASRHNERFKSAVVLARSGRERRRNQKILLDGIHLVQTYLARFGAASIEVYVTREASMRPEVTDILAALNVSQVVGVSAKLMNELSAVDSPIGIVAIADLPNVTTTRSTSSEFWVVLEGVQDPGNMGSILRTAAASGVSQILLTHGCADPWAPKCLRGGMGAQFLVPLALQVKVTDALANFRGAVLATAPSGGTPLYGVDLRGNVALLFGGEGAGLSAALLSLATARVSLPMRAGVESLNLGAAVAACCFERLRQMQLDG